jgi:hypothetical protein
MTCCVAVPSEATAQKSPNSGDQHTFRHATAFAAVRAVHTAPSGLVMTCWAAVPSEATAQKSPNCGDQHTFCHATAFAAVRAVHAAPSGLVMTRWAAVPVCETAQNNFSSGDQHTAVHATAADDVRAIHVFVGSTEDTPVSLTSMTSIVMTRWFVAVPFVEIAQNVRNSGDQQMLCHRSTLGAVRAVHVVPSKLTIIC